MNGHRFSFGQYKGDLIIDHNVVKIIRLSSIKKYLVDRIDNIIFCNSKEY